MQLIFREYFRHFTRHAFAWTIVAVLLCTASSSGFAQHHYNAAAREESPLIFKASFNKRRELQQWTQRPAQTNFTLKRNGSGNRALCVKAKQNGNYLFSVSLPVQTVAGRKLLMRIRVRNDGISTRRRFVDGVKIVVHFSSPAGEAYPQLHLPSEPFGWQEVGFTTAVPPLATQCEFSIGLDGVSGKALFDDVEIRLAPIDSNASYSGAPAPTNAQTLRGAMIPTFATAEDLRTLAGWGANHARWQLTWNSFPQSPADTASLASYNAWLRGALEHIEKLLPLCDSLDLHILLDLHTLPGGYPYPGQANRLFGDTALQTAFRNIWKEIATRFRDAPTIWGYDLANEPSEGYLPEGVMDWQHLAAATAADIRNIDTVHYIVVEAAPYGSWIGLLSFQPLKDIGKAVYSFHTYDPMAFTHQGIDGSDSDIHYPGLIAGHYWNADTLRRFLQPARDWQLQHGVSMHIGEFSAVRWAPDSSAYFFLRDCINLFEAWGWSWDYHAFREWDGWSVEHGHDSANHQRLPQPTERQLLLMEAFKKNKAGH